MTGLKAKPRSVIAKALLLILGTGVLVLAGVALLFAALLNRAPVPAPEKPKTVRVDKGELQDYIDIDIPVAAVKWEVFRTPEDEGLWGNLDFSTILIAEIDLAAPEWAQPRRPPMQYDSVAEESPRPWLTPHFRELMRKATKKGVLAKEPHCGVYEATMQKSGRLVDGYFCAHAEKVLLYITIDTQV